VFWIVLSILLYVHFVLAVSHVGMKIGLGTLYWVMVQAMADGGGPRQPWHDLHCKIEGPASYDVLTNFEQRWRKATRWHEEELIQISRISWILSPSPNAPPEGDPKLYMTSNNEPSAWHAQVFRSIDSGSVKGFPRTTAGIERAVCFFLLSTFYLDIFSFLTQVHMQGCEI
jgi:phosphatidylserine/phosphatidylglycerophosphate/cardiolipin synthase-like enzyme